MYNVDLSGKIALVTGGSRGIGRYIAEAIHDAGASVIITGRTESTLKDAAEEIGEGCQYRVCDQRNPEAIAALALSVEKDPGFPDILVNNAGIMAGGHMVTNTSLELWNETLETNLTGVFLTTQAFLPSMIKKQQGDIFIVGSMSGKKGDPGWAAYSASKFGLQGFAEAVFYEVRGHNIRVMVLNPSTVATGPDTGATEGSGVYAHASDVAATVLHLCGLPRRSMVKDIEIWGTNP